MATERLARLLTPSHEVRRFNTSPETSEHVRADPRFDIGRMRHYASLRQQIQQTLCEAPEAPVLWASISPSPLGHLRDALTVLPGFQPGQSVYAVVHWGNFDRVFRHPATALTARRMVRNVRGFVFLNDQLARNCAGWIPEVKRLVIPNTIDDAVLCTNEEVSARRGRRGDRLRLLFLSNMIASKGYLDVLEAVRLLHARGIGVHADFVGHWTSENDRVAFEQRIETGGLGDVVTHHGGVSDRARIKALYLGADVFLLPSYYPTEAQPLTIIEALNAGTPVIVTRHSGIPDMVSENQDAVFVPPQSPEAIADAVQRLAEYDTWKTFSHHARRQFLSRFSPAAVRRQWVELVGGG